MLRDIPAADNVQLYIRGRLQQYLSNFTEWADTWGLMIDPKKTFMQHFTKRRIACPVVKIRQQVIEAKKDQRLLGMVFDSPRLTWNSHVTCLKQDCLKRIDLLKAFSSSVWGASTSLLRNFYVAYIRSKIDYGSIVYGSASKTALKKLDIVQNACLRLVLGGRNTTPILSLQAEACIAPLGLHRDYLNVKQLIKLKCSPPNSVSAKMLKLAGPTLPSYDYPFNSYPYRAVKSAQLIDMPPVKRTPTASFTVPPWSNVNNLIETQYKDQVHNNVTFNKYVDRHYKGFKHIFTDGSKTSDDARISAASALYSPSQSLSICWKLHPDHSVISTELFAIWKALISVRESEWSAAVIFTDSRSALQMISSNCPTYGNVVTRIKDLLLSLNAEVTVVLHWVKAHCGITGNEIADRSANKGHDNDRSELYELTQCEYVSMLKRHYKLYWNDNWKFTTELTRKGMFLRGIRDNISGVGPVAKFHNRRHEVVIHRLRMGHSGVKGYLGRFHMEESEDCADCQVPDSVEHYLLQCTTHQGQRAVMYRKLATVGIDRPNLKTILGGDERLLKKRRDIFKILLDYIKSTGKMDLL
jgi:ribonuclease HI